VFIYAACLPHAGLWQEPNLNLQPESSNSALRATTLCCLRIRGRLCDQQFGHDGHKVDTKDTTFIAINSQLKSSNCSLPGLQLCDLCVSVVFFVTSNLVTTSTKLTQWPQRLSPINPQPKSSNCSLPGLLPSKRY